MKCDIKEKVSNSNIRNFNMSNNTLITGKKHL